MKKNIKTATIAALIGAAATVGALAGTGDASAEVKPGSYAGGTYVGIGPAAQHAALRVTVEVRGGELIVAGIAHPIRSTATGGTATVAGQRVELLYNYDPAVHADPSDPAMARPDDGSYTVLINGTTWGVLTPTR
ncbi:MAG: hypothetical protein QM658_03430 [Gordonia sp. (in: high G+C Gram-positive bacteria)]